MSLAGKLRSLREFGRARRNDTGSTVQYSIVIPAKAGIQIIVHLPLDSRSAFGRRE
jgi:hypothetical protein